MSIADFERTYAGDPDPFGVGSRWYERRKERIVLASLTRERYGLAWDAACGTGHLAVALTSRCDRVVASDGSAHAVALTTGLARSRGVTVETRLLELPGTPDGVVADLVVLGEVLYYLDARGRCQTVDAVLDGLAPGGEVVAVHWRRRPHDGHASGDQVTAELDARCVGAGLVRTVRHEDAAFTVAVWTRPAPAPSTGPTPAASTVPTPGSGTSPTPDPAPSPVPSQESR